MDPAVQIFQSIFQPGLILFPCHAVHSGRSLTFQTVIAVPQPIDTHMVKQCREPFLFVLPRSLAHTTVVHLLDRLTIARHCQLLPTLCWLGVRFHVVLLSQRPSLRNLRLPRLHESCSAASQVVRLCSTPRPRSCTDCAFGFPCRSGCWLAPDAGEVSRFSRVQFLDVLMALGLRRICGELAISFPSVWPSR